MNPKSKLLIAGQAVVFEVSDETLVVLRGAVALGEAVLDEVHAVSVHVEVAGEVVPIDLFPNV